MFIDNIHMCIYNKNRYRQRRLIEMRCLYFLYCRDEGGMTYVWNMKEIMEANYKEYMMRKKIAKGNTFAIANKKMNILIQYGNKVSNRKKLNLSCISKFK